MKRKTLTIVLLLVGFLLCIGASVVAGFYDAICAIGFDPSACGFTGFIFGIAATICGVVALVGFI